MFKLNNKNLKFILFIFLLLFVYKFSNAQEKNYLDSVIKRINDLELELKNIQDTSPDSYNNNDNYMNTIASHEQRLIELEEEIRNLNGNLEQINFRIENIYKLLKNVDTKQLEQTEDEDTNLPLNQKLSTNQSLDKETTIIEDPNVKKNPSMKVLGTVNENLNEEIITENNIPETKGGAPQQGIIEDDKITSLLKKPSDIYSYAYDMLVRENFIEAEKSFKAFIGEHPEDPLASNA